MAVAGAATFISPSCVFVVDVVAAAGNVDDELVSPPAAAVFGLTSMLKADFRVGFMALFSVDSGVFFETSVAPCMCKCKIQYNYYQF